METVELSSGHRILFYQLCDTGSKQHAFEMFEAPSNIDDDENIPLPVVSLIVKD